MNSVELANKILDYLKENSQNYIRTRRLLGAIGIPNIYHHQAIREKVLYPLEASGVIKNCGVGVQRWKIINKNWDRNKPFGDVVTFGVSAQERFLR